MRYREVVQAVAGGRFAPNVKGEVRRVKISPFALRTSNFVYLLPARYRGSPPFLSLRLRVKNIGGTRLPDGPQNSHYFCRQGK
jgi:hypothetical protein